jgi:L-asparaginase II
MDAGALLAVETRSGHPEVANLGHAVLVRPDGAIERSWGDPYAPCYWRSTAKPLQAIPLAQARARLGLGPAEVAVACGSHTGEQPHLDAVRRILEAAGVDEAELRCGTHPPWGRRSAFTVEAPRPIHNNCSGCHAGLLAACRAEDLPTEGYLRPEHPLQQRLRATAQEASGESVGVGVDGCGLPAFRTPLVGLARAYQWVQATVPEVLEAMGQHPALVGGEGEFDTDLMAATGGRVVGKFGALGVYAALERTSGVALAVRLTTGNETVAEAVAGHILARAGVLRPAETDALARHLKVAVVNNLGDTVGEVAFRV